MRRSRLLPSRGVLAWSAAALFLGGATVVAIACTPSGPTTKPLPVEDDEAGVRHTVNNDDDDFRTNPDPTGESDPPLPDGGKPPGRVYAHTGSTLYVFDPLAKTLKAIGDFSCLATNDSVIDIALNRDGEMYGTTFGGFMKIDPIAATCQYVKVDASANYPNSLGFVPLGTVDPTKEALVGYRYDDDTHQQTNYVRIDLDTGAITKIGDLNDPAAPIQWRSSGDIVALIRDGNRAFLTVQSIDPDASTGNDSLAEVDPATGKLKSILGDTGKTQIFGLGQWAGTGYGFSSTGEVLQLDMTTGAATTLMTLTLDGGAVGQWYGAGVTTEAPTKP